MHDKPLPAAPDAERATLGSILLNREAIIPIAPWLRPGAFYLEKHAWIYQAMLDCYDRGEPPDLRLVAAELARRDRLEAIGGVPYLADLIDAVPTSYHVEYYARLVQQAAVNRGLIDAARHIAAIGYDNQDADAATAAAQAALDQVHDRPATDDDLVPLSAIVDEQYTLIERAQDSGEPITPGVPTGFRDLDELLGGLHRGDLIVLAARPSVGKSALAASIAYQVGSAEGRVSIFSLEMGRDQYAQRLAAIDSGINLHGLRHGHMRMAELEAYMQTLGRLAGLPIAISDAAGASVRDIRARILRRAAKDGAPDLVIIDYLQLMVGSRGESRQQEVSDISRGLKTLARELDVPILALSQLSRAVEGRTSHVPMLSDLRESGAIEQDADVVAFIYREELYDRETDKKGIAEIHIAKHRNGPIGVAPMRFDANTTRFQTLTYREPDGYATNGHRPKESVWPSYD
jgi:replicative DNA helicase